MLRKAGVLALLSLFIIATGMEASAAQRFDGEWAIYIFGAPGKCAFGYRLPIRITGQTVLYKGRAVSKAAVGITSGGTVAIRIGAGRSLVTGTGALNSSRGSGKWVAPSFRCTGSWRAERQ